MDIQKGWIILYNGNCVGGPQFRTFSLKEFLGNHDNSISTYTMQERNDLWRAFNLQSALKHNALFPKYFIVNIYQIAAPSVLALFVETFGCRFQAFSEKHSYFLFHSGVSRPQLDLSSVH